MTEILATHFVEEKGYPMRVFRSSSYKDQWHDDVTKIKIIDAPWPLQNECWKKGEAVCSAPEDVYKMTLFWYMDLCSPNMIDITSNFSIHQESPVFVYALSFCTVFFAHSIL